MSKKPSRTAYNELVFNRNDQPYDRVDKWATDMSTDIDDIEMYTCIFNSYLCSKSVEVRSFLYRFYLRDLYPRKRLHTMKIVDSPLCLKCNQSEESVMHMFWQCVEIRGLWTDVRNWIKNILKIQLPMEPSIMLLYYEIDIPVEYYPVIVLILTLVKKLIYDNKDNCRMVNFIQVKRYIGQIEFTERHIAMEKKTTSETCKQMA